jgi:hypothetical protein
MIMSVNTNEAYRQGSRRRHHIYVEVKPLGLEDSELIDALMADISDSGLSLITDLPLPLGTRVEISLTEKAAVLGEIMNIEQHNSRELVRMGVRFVKAR